MKYNKIAFMTTLVAMLASPYAIAAPDVTPVVTSTVLPVLSAPTVLPTVLPAPTDKTPLPLVDTLVPSANIVETALKVEGKTDGVADALALQTPTLLGANSNFSVRLGGGFYRGESAVGVTALYANNAHTFGIDGGMSINRTKKLAFKVGVQFNF